MQLLYQQTINSRLFVTKLASLIRLKTKLAASLMAVFVSLILPAQVTRAQVTLDALNSSVTVNNTGASAGVVNWTIDGQNVLNSSQSGLQWFYFSTGLTPPAAQGIQNIQNVGSPSVSTVSQPTPGTATFTTTYANTVGDYNLQMTYLLTGNAPGSGTGGLQEAVTIQNNSASGLRFVFYQYTDITIPPATVALGTDPFGTSFDDGALRSGPIVMQEQLNDSLSPGANLGQLNLSLSTLTGGPGAYQLALNPSAGQPAPVAGNVYVTEWILNIGAGLGATITGGNTITGIVPAPEPATWSLAFVGLLAFGAVRRLRRSSR
jgi:hypothetical protein